MAPKQRRALRSATKASTRPSRQANPTISYRESSSEVETRGSETEIQEGSDDSADYTSTKWQPMRLSPNKMTPRRRRRPSQSLAASVSSAILFETRKRKRTAELNNSRLGRGKVNNANPTSQNDFGCGSRIPPWASLPYQILIQIFYYASNPLYDDPTFQPSASVDWLVKTSRLCRAFTEPALTILYRSPPLVPMDRAHRLRQLLVADPEPMSYNYRAKVERLQLEVSQTAAYTLPGSGLLDLHGLVYHCPRLLDLEFYHQKDFSPYRRLDESIKWTYPDSLFVALNRNVSGAPTNLRSWRWSSRLAGKKRPLESLFEIHQSPSFRGLGKIAFVNYHKAAIRKNAQDPRHERLLAYSLSVLSKLEHLTFESCSLANSTLFPLLPQNLKHLELINCEKVTSDDLAAFLTSHGSQLRTLTLNHNHSLSISFLIVLGSACRQLETLKMNLTYYNAHSTYRDSNPGYKKLLHINERPDWPASLRTIELTQLRQWEVDTAKMFFRSLLESAVTLANLRRLVIKAILNTNWRDRSSFRDEWVGAFQRVFKRVFTPPNPHFRSLGTYAAYMKRRDDCQPGLQENDNNVTFQPLKNPRPTRGGDISYTQSGPKRRLRSADEPHSALTWKPAPSRAKGSTNGDIEVDKQGECSKIHQAPNTHRSTRHAAVSLSPSLDADEYSLGQNLRRQNEVHDGYSTDNSSPQPSRPSLRETNKKHVVNRELGILKKTAGTDRPSQDVYSDVSSDGAGLDHNSDSDDMPLARRRHTLGAEQPEYIQGMCDVVSITIDNLRPRETQFVEADFLDSEPEGDEDWDGTEDLIGDGRYAW